MDRKEEAQRRRGADAGETPSVDAEEERRRARRQAGGPAPGAPRSAEDRAVEGANEWKDDSADERGGGSPPGGIQR
jgi:hypothetical protein